MSLLRTAMLTLGLLLAAQPFAARSQGDAADPAATTADSSAIASPATLPEPTENEVQDLPNDDGTHLAVLWRWQGDVPEKTPLAVEVLASSDMLAKYQLTEAEQNRIRAAREKLAAELVPLLPDRDRLAGEAATAQEALTVAQNTITQTKDYAGLEAARKSYWQLQVQFSALQDKIQRAKDAFTRALGPKLIEKAQQYDYLSAAISKNDHLVADTESPETVGDEESYFGHEPDDADKNLLIVNGLKVPNPSPIDAPHDEYDESPPPSLPIPFEAGKMYVLRMAVGAAPDVRNFELGGAEPKTNWFKSTVANNLIVAGLFSLIIMVAISLARKHPEKLFIRRIAGLEAVDEAIGRATEMGKPVLFLNGMTDLTDLSTLAAVNILGRVARRIADYDSQLMVPCRDPVVMTVAQEIVRSGYMDAGRPDAFRPQDVYFLTQDQFSYTASVCGIMVRERPAANFFMGYYYAESLLLAETGQSTGAIQIAGTDSQTQLPFFITTCDYTLIGEELYAASAYLSREPLLLGSLKGQDVAKATMMLLIIFQTLLFVYKLVAHSDAPLDFIRNLVQPL